MSRASGSSRARSTSWRLRSFADVECFRAVDLRQRYVRHSHEGFAIGVFEDGVGGSEYRGSTCYITPGRIVAMNPAEPHTGFAAGDRGLTYRMVYVGSAFFEQVLQLRSRPWFAEVSIQDDACARTFLALHRRSEAGAGCLQTETELMETLSALATRYGRTPAPSPGQEPAAVVRAKEFLRENCARRVSVGELAAAAELSPSHLIRTFRRATGMPPHAWQLQERIVRAKALLARGRTPIDVALDLGFADQSHLTRRFRALTGLTPAAYARARRGW